MSTYNPFPETETTPLWVNLGTCYATAWYADQADAEKVQAVVRAKGGTVNGGMLHGLPLGDLVYGRQQSGEPQYGITF